MKMDDEIKMAPQFDYSKGMGPYYWSYILHDF
jgi:hypothetical protein